MRDAIRYTLIAAVAFCASLAAAADVTKRIDVAPGPVELRIDKPASSDYLIRWDARQPLDIQSLGPYESRTVMVVNAQPPGAQLVIDAEVIDWVAKLPTTTRFIINVGGTPPPPDVTPPDVKPDPKPDDTKPTQIAPIALPGLRVLMVFESSEGPPDAFTDGNVQEWLTANCAVGEANVAEWRMIDQHDTFRVGKAAEHWKSAAARPRTSVPWVIISNGTANKGYEGRPPETADAFLQLLKGYK